MHGDLGKTFERSRDPSITGSRGDRRRVVTICLVQATGCLLRQGGKAMQAQQNVFGGYRGNVTNAEAGTTKHFSLRYNMAILEAFRPHQDVPIPFKATNDMVIARDARIHPVILSRATITFLLGP